MTQELKHRPSATLHAMALPTQDSILP